ncbi:MAG TPA: prepilin-type cleavage/methylation domain-containing protein, partial [Gallionella sp.]|nr:prepilin-type cleavage/methylation domain-containing protein [Gallionella sp.]
GYQDKFKALPGDDAGVAIHVVGTLATTGGTVGNGLIEGNWNSYTSTDESYLFWQHVRLAGLTSGPTVVPAAPAAGDGYKPVNAVGGEIGIQSGTSDVAKTPINAGPGATNPIRGTYIICSPNILGKFAKQLDIQLDDGVPNTGSMMSVVTTTTPYAIGATASATVNDADTVTVCMGV